MKYITFLAKVDWANVLTLQNLCLQMNSSKYKSMCVCSLKHHFNYNIKHEYNLCSSSLPHPPILDHIIKSNIIIIACEEPPPNQLGWIKNNYPQIFNIIKKKKIIYFFCSDKYLYLYKNLQERNAFIVPEFKNYNNPIIIPGTPVEIPNTIYEILDERYKNNKIVVTHINSRRKDMRTKGSLWINKIMGDIVKNNKNIKYNFIDFQEKSFEEIMEIKKNTDIYIDQYNMPVGGFGTSSIEALTYGCIILCTIGNLNENLFKIIDKENFPIIDITGDTCNLKKIISNICSLKKEDIMDISKKNIEWVRENLSVKKTCSILENYLDYYEPHENEWLAFKSHWKLSCNKLTSTSETFLKKNELHSSKLDDTLKIKIPLNKEVLYIKEFNNNYYLVSHPF